MRIVFQLDNDDIGRFQAALERARQAVRCADEHDIIEAAKHAIDHLPLAQAPGYVRQRMQQVQRLIAMVEDEAWALPAPERDEVLKTLAYVADPEDLIPDHVEMIGLLDDIIMVEILLRDLRHMLAAFDDFVRYRMRLGTPSPGVDARIGHAARLARRRVALIARMRRRHASTAGVRDKPRANLRGSS